MKVWVVRGTTESGDDYLFAWLNRPTPQDIRDAVKRQMPDECEGDYPDEWTANQPEAAEEVETEDA